MSMAFPVASCNHGSSLNGVVAHSGCLHGHGLIVEEPLQHYERFRASAHVHNSMAHTVCLNWAKSKRNARFFICAAVDKRTWRVELRTGLTTQIHSRFDAKNRQVWMRDTTCKYHCCHGWSAS